MTRTNGIQHLLYCNVGQPRPGYFVSRLPVDTSVTTFLLSDLAFCLIPCQQTGTHNKVTKDGPSRYDIISQSLVLLLCAQPHSYKSTAAPKPRSPGRTGFVYRILAILTRSSHESSTSLASAVRSACMVMERTKQGRRDSRRTSNRTFSPSAPTQATLSW